MKFFGVLLAVILLLIAAGAGFVWSGFYNVAASVPHWQGTSAVLEVARERSIDYHSDGISPPSLDDPELLESGFHHFHPMCRMCHGAPGYERLEFAKGLYPSPPDLTDDHVREEFTDAQIFWIVQNGLKMTGMPAFGPTHSDNELWGLVAVVNQLPEMTPEEYRAKIGTQGHGEGMEGHRHGGENDSMSGHGHGEEEHSTGTEQTQEDGHSPSGDHAH